MIFVDWTKSEALSVVIIHVRKCKLKNLVVKSITD